MCFIKTSVSSSLTGRQWRLLEGYTEWKATGPSSSAFWLRASVENDSIWSIVGAQKRERRFLFSLMVPFFLFLLLKYLPPFPSFLVLEYMETSGKPGRNDNFTVSNSDVFCLHPVRQFMLSL